MVIEGFANRAGKLKRRGHRDAEPLKPDVHETDAVLPTKIVEHQVRPISVVHPASGEPSANVNCGAEREIESVVPFGIVHGRIY